jgi:hypothetical protein
MTPDLPANRDAERLVLGAIVLDNNAYVQAAQSLSPDDFSLDSHRRLYQCMAGMVAANMPIDTVTLHDELGRRNELQTIGGAAYLCSLTDGAVRRSSIAHYVQIVKEKAQLRRIIHLADAAITRAMEGNPSTEIAGGLLQSALDIEAQSQKGRNRKLFVPASTFVSQAPEQIDWLVEGVIERGANGFFSAVPKGGKSWAAVDLALSLALGCDWLGFKVPEAVRVALISREDNPSLTAWRIRHLFQRKSSPAPALIETNLYVNSRRESAELMLDNPEQMAELLAALKLLKPRFAIFDVFNVLHSADENDNQEMRTILRQLSTIQAEIECGIGVIHHYNKADQGSMTQRLRGSSAIAGWAEWLVGISMADEESKTRRMEFELKAAQPPDPIYFRIDSALEGTKLALAEAPAAARRREGGAAERFMQ